MGFLKFEDSAANSAVHNKKRIRKENMGFMFNTAFISGKSFSNSMIDTLLYQVDGLIELLIA